MKAHVYKQIILDEQGRQITRHQIWTTNIKAYDNTINAGRSDVVRFRFRMPEGRRGETMGLTMRARVNYRRFNQEYTNYVLTRQNRQLTVPVVRMAEAEVKISDRVTGRRNDAANSGRRTPDSAVAKRWNDYGIGLLEQAQYGAASDAFRRASEIDPADPNLLVNAAIAELRTERFGPEREQLHRAEALLERALQIPPSVVRHPQSLSRARYYRALVWRADGKLAAAVAELKQIAGLYPRDREVQRQFGQTLYSLGRLTDARAALETIIAIDPTDAGAWQFLAPIYTAEGRSTEADRARSLYLLWRDDPRADGLATRFFAAHPQWADERILSHTHGEQSPHRPILTGLLAGPEK